LADEKLALQPEIDEWDTTDDELLPPRRHRAPHSSGDDELYSSSIGSDDYDLAFGLFNNCHGGNKEGDVYWVNRRTEASSSSKRVYTAAVATSRKETDGGSPIEGGFEGGFEEDEDYGLEDPYSIQGDSYMNILFDAPGQPAFIIEQENLNKRVDDISSDLFSMLLVDVMEQRDARSTFFSYVKEWRTAIIWRDTK
ncbi:hypothetical protein BGZ65_007313, partial [Modicella reniformis]